MFYELLVTAGLLVCLWFIRQGLRAPDHDARLPFILAAASSALWYANGLAVELAPSPDIRLLVTNLSPSAIVPTFWFTLLLINAHIGTIPRRLHLRAFAAVGLWTAFLVTVHLVPSLRWIFADYSYTIGPEGRVEIHRTVGAIYYWVLAFNLVAYFATASVVVRSVIRSSRLHRIQQIGMLVAALMPFSGYVVQAVLNLDEHSDAIMLLSFLPAVATFYWLTVRKQLLTNAPISRTLLIDAMPDPVLVISDGGQIRAVNRAARELGGLSDDAVGTGLSAYPALSAVLAPHLETGAASVDIQVPTAEAGDPRSFAVRITPYATSRHASGRILAFRDITERTALQKTLFETLTQLQDRLNENIALQEKLREQAARDPLTGLHNRRHCTMLQPELLRQAEKEGTPMAVILMDIDHFKSVNDQLGHPAGDAVICALAACLRDMAPARAHLFRYGGEEFLAILPGTDTADALRMTNEWRRAFLARSAALPDVGRPVDFSAGVAEYPSSASGWSDLVSSADRALYVAKQSGRGRSVAWTEALHAASDMAAPAA